MEVLVQYQPSGAVDEAADFQSPARRAQRRALGDRIGATAVRELAAERIEVVKLVPGVDADRAAKAFERDPSVASAEPNYTYRTQVIPNDSYFGGQWALHNTGQTGGQLDADIDAPEAWNVTKGRPSVVVVVLDTGIDYRHPDLAASVWTNPREVPDDGIDNDRNGYVDDVHGFDMVDQDGDPMDENGHGTHVAGIIAARGGNETGISGVAPRVQVAACRFLDAGGSGTTDDAISCLNYVRALRRAGVNVVATNNSWAGGDESELLYRAIRNQTDVLFVAAAGNDSGDLDEFPTFPASYALPNIIPVAASDHRDRLADFSNSGRSSVGLSAPGDGILSLRAAGTDLYGDGAHFFPEGDPNAEYYLASGTSMAAPHVAGVIALLESRAPARDWKALRNLVLAGADPVAATEVSTITGRRLNARGALRCSDRSVFTIVGPPPEFPLPAGTPVTFSVLNILCADPAGPVRARTSTGSTFAMRDDGRGRDLAAGDGIYTATFTPGADTDLVTFTNGTSSLTLPHISFGPYVPGARVGVPFEHQLQASGTAPYRWSIIAGSLPTGLTLGAADGRITGTPDTVGRSTVTVRVVDALSRVAVADLTVAVHDDGVDERLLTADRDGWPVTPLDSVTDADGNTVVVGYSIDPVTLDEDWVVKKYSAAGELLWSHYRVSTTTWWANWATGVDVDRDGNVYVVGGYPYFHADSDFVVVKFDPDGNELWATSYSEGWIEVPSAVTVDPVGDIVVTGSESGTGATKVLTAKFHPTGELAWARTFQANQLDYGFDIGTDADGGIYIAGRSGYVFAVDGNVTWFGHTPLVLKYSPVGEALWSEAVPDPNVLRIDQALAIAVADDGSSYVGGEMSSEIRRYTSDGVRDGGPVVYHRDQYLRVESLALDAYGGLVLAGRAFDFDAFRWVYVVAGVEQGAPDADWARELVGENRDSGIDVSVSGANVARVTFPHARGGVVLTSFNPVLRIATTELPRGVRGVGYDQRLRASGGVPARTWQVTAGALPPGLTLDTATGAIGGIPTAAGIYTFTATVTDAVGESQSREYTVPVEWVVYDGLLVPPVANVGVAWQAQLYAQGLTPFTWRLVAGQLPPGITLSTSGLLSGTPTLGGDYPITVDVRDPEGHAATGSLTIRVVAPLAVTTASLPTGTVGSAYTAVLEAMGGTPPYQWFVSPSLPDGLALDAATGEISGVPMTAGTYEINVFVMDATALWVMQPLTLSIT